MQILGNLGKYETYIFAPPLPPFKKRSRATGQGT